MQIGPVSGVPEAPAVREAVVRLKAMAEEGIQQLSREQRPREAEHPGSLEALREDLKRLTEQANNLLKHFQRHLEYSIHEPTRTVIVRLIDDRTEEVIREIPSEDLLNLYVNLMELAGLLVNHRE
ncbi:MAG: flagellar protein FlaG [Desulfotomaculales bacterium]